MNDPANTSQLPWTTRHVIIFFGSLILFEMAVKTYLSIFEFPVTVLSDMLSAAGMNDAACRSAAILLITAVVRICMLSALFHFVRVHWKSTIQQIGIQTKDLKKDLVSGGLIILLLSALSLIIWGIPFLIYQKDLSTFLLQGPNATKYFTDPVYISVCFLVVCLIAPFVEEVVFRGFIYPSLRNKTSMFLGTPGIVIAILLNTGLFTVLHLDWSSLEIYPNAVSGLVTSRLSTDSLIAFQQAFLPLAQPLAGGILFCILYERTRRITTPFLVHCAANTGILIINVIHALNNIPA